VGLWVNGWGARADSLAAGGGVLIGGLVYAALLFALRIPEAAIALSVLRRRLHR
jgi:hypothetical protein